MDERLMVPVALYNNPRSEQEDAANALAHDMYNKLQAQVNGDHAFMFGINTDDPSMVNVAAFGWTPEGWRTFAIQMTDEKFLNFVEMCADFVTAYQKVNAVMQMVKVSPDPVMAARQSLKVLEEEGGDRDCKCENHRAAKALKKCLDSFIQRTVQAENEAESPE
jgi:hypothetical protein